MDIKSFLNYLQRSPVILRGNEIPLIFLEDDAHVIRDPQLLLELIDSPDLMDESQIVVMGDVKNNPWSFPVVEVSEDVFNENLNYTLCKNYKKVGDRLFSQKNVVDRILTNLNFDVIIVIIVDGLSYVDVRNIPDVQPCFVNGSTLTKIGLQNIINSPPISYRLYNEGFKNRIGFSYWDRDEELTNLAFKGFAHSQMNKVREFNEIENKLYKLEINGTYIQIVVEGCDQVCHRNRGRPLVKALVTRLFDDYIDRLSKIIKAKNLTGVIYLVADHGIWWRETINGESSYKIIEHPQATSKRYILGNVVGEHLVNLFCYGSYYSLLEYPYVYGDYATNEWGTHGGISIYESFVPFYIKEVL